MTDSKNALRLRIMRQDGTTGEACSSAESLLVGTGEGAGLRLSDPQASALHLMLKRDGSGGVVAIDLGSERGTRWRNQEIRTPVTLSAGDVLEVGGTRLEVLLGESEGQGDRRTLAHGAAAKEVDPLARAPRKSGRQAQLFSRPLPVDQRPTAQDRVLQVAMLWGDTILDIQHFADGVPVTVGEDEENCFQVFHPEIGDSFALAVARGPKLSATMPAEAAWTLKSETDEGGDPLTDRRLASNVARPGESVVAELRDRLIVSLGDICFVLRFVRRQPGVRIRVLDESDIGFLKFAAVCAVASIALLAAFFLGDKRVSRIESGGFQAPAQYARLLIRPEPKRKSPKKELSGVPEGAKAKDEEGKFGVKNAKQEEADSSRPGTPVVDPRKREDDRKRVMTAGLLGAWGKTPDASNILGPGGLGTGINQALGGLKPGAGLVDARGVGGLGSRGSGIGGGGTALGLGGLGTKGDGRGIGGSGSLDLSGRGKETTRVVPGKTHVVGGLSKDVIAKIIRSHQSEIKYCYEIELQKKPSLFGKVAVLFIIDAAGTVSEASVSESSLDNSNTEQCMLSRIRRWKFPEPEGGGLVTVNFPWIFKPAGGEES